MVVVAGTKRADCVRAVANWYNMDTMTSSPSQINFLVFVPLWSFISIAYLEVVPKFAPRGKVH